ncbi:MAG: putative quinol monooxygenase [Limisphaerales bacterium]
MIHVIATIRLAAGQREAFLTRFHALVPRVHAEKGCLEYGPAVPAPTTLLGNPANEPDTVVVVEKWESLPALEAHLATPHMQEFFAEMKELMKNVQALVLQPA